MNVLICYKCTFLVPITIMLLVKPNPVKGGVLMTSFIIVTDYIFLSDLQVINSVLFLISVQMLLLFRWMYDCLLPD